MTRDFYEFCDYLLQAYSTLRETETDEAMLEKMIELIGETPFTDDDLKIAGFLFFKKLRAANLYKPAGTLRGQVTLFKAKDNFVKLNKDYGLSKVR